MLNTYPLLSRVAARARTTPDAVAITVPPFEASYARLAADVLRLASRLAGADGLREARVALLVNKGYLAALGLLAIWAAGGIAVPVLPSLPIPEQAYLVNTADCAVVLVDKSNRARAEQLVAQKTEGESLEIMEVAVEDLVEEVGDAAAALEALAPIDGEARAMMLFTSGTTGRPKGAVTRHSSLAAQVESTVEAWRWTESDNLLHILPLNHLHGIAVGLLPTLWAGASVEMWDKFDANKVGGAVCQLHYIRLADSRCGRAGSTRTVSSRSPCSSSCPRATVSVRELWASQRFETRSNVGCMIHAQVLQTETFLGMARQRPNHPLPRLGFGSTAHTSASNRGPQGHDVRAAGRGFRRVLQAPPPGVRIRADARQRKRGVGERDRRWAVHPRAVRDDGDGVDCRNGVGEREARQGESSWRTRCGMA